MYKKKKKKDLVFARSLEAIQLCIHYNSVLLLRNCI